MRSVIALAQTLNLAVMAEGIETSTQLAQLQSLGCNKGEGYYFTKPLWAEAATALLDSHEERQAAWSEPEPKSRRTSRGPGWRRGACQALPTCTARTTHRTASAIRYPVTDRRFMSVTDTKSAPVGTRIIFENDRVRVWEIELAPRETLPMHFHELDYVVVSLGGGPTTVEWQDGRRETSMHAPGEVQWRSAPHAHALTNSGTATYRNCLIELKEH